MDFLVLQTPTTHAQSLATWLRLSLLLDKRWGAGHALHSEQVWRETGTCLTAPHANGGEERVLVLAELLVRVRLAERAQDLEALVDANLALANLPFEIFEAGHSGGFATL